MHKGALQSGVCVQRKWVLIAIGIAVAAAALVGIQMWMVGRQHGGSVAEQGAKASGESSVPAAGDVDGSTDGTPTEDGPPLEPGSTAPQARPIDPSTIPPASQVGSSAPSGTIAQGSILPRLTSSPRGMISGLGGGTIPAGSAYTITFRPWGFGFNDPKGRTLVVTIDAIKPVKKAPPQGRLVGPPVLLVMDAKHGGTIGRGGTYSGRVTFVAEGGTLVPLLSLVTQ